MLASPRSKASCLHAEAVLSHSLDQLVPGDGCVRGARRLTDAGGSFD